jgi:hypothetical protein
VVPDSLGAAQVKDVLVSHPPALANEKLFRDHLVPVDKAVQVVDALIGIGFLSIGILQARSGRESEGIRPGSEMRNGKIDAANHEA